MTVSTPWSHRWMLGWALLLSLSLLGCRVSVSVGDHPAEDPEDDSDTPHYQPPPDVSWQLQLQGAPQLAIAASLYELDLFDTSAQTIATLHSQHRKLLCYFSAGSLEEWRPDASRLPSEVLGAPLAGWPGEVWLDIRASEVRELMRSRLQLAHDKGCDGVDPDNVDGYLQNSGFALSAADQLDYNRFLAREAHALGLTIALKNDLLQIPALVSSFDLAINEQCHAYQECQLLTPFVQAGKPVLNIEYDERFMVDAQSQQQLCDEAELLGLQTQVLTPELDGTIRLRCF